MHRLLILATLLGLTAISARAQAPTEAQTSPKEVVEQVWKMNADGAWLSRERWEALQDSLGSVGPWFPTKSVFVLKSYRIGDARMDARAGGLVGCQVEVDYAYWGSIDPFLNFIRTRGTGPASPATGDPAEQKGYETLYLSDHFVKMEVSGEEESAKGPLRWRIGTPVFPRANVDAALLWVTEMRDASSDPAMKHNADRTIAILKSLSVGAPASARPVGAAQESASEVGKRFVALESNSTPDTWNSLTTFFVETPKPKWNRVHIVDIVGSGVDINEDSADFVVSTNALGDLDSALQISRYPSMRLPLVTPSASACFGDDRFGFTLLLPDTRWDAADGGEVKRSTGPLTWRIEDTSFEPLITLDTAIRYVRQASAKTTDTAVKANAARTLSILKHYNQGKPLPAELTSAAAGGCD